MNANHPHHRVFQRIRTGMDHDLHLHSRWSQDILNGPTMADYIPLAERYNIHIGFADHYELLYYGKENKRNNPRTESPWSGEWRLNPDTIDQYLEEIDALKEEYPHVSSGLEIDFYPTRIPLLQEFVDRYRSEFDLLIGSVHEVEDYRPVTLMEDFIWLKEKYGSFDAVVDKYFEIEKIMVETGIFDVLSHPDVVYRFQPAEDRITHPNYGHDPRVIELGHLCENREMLMEIKVSGYRYDWGQSFPVNGQFHHLLAHGVQFTVGSDSHSLENFEQSILDIRKANNFINEFQAPIRVCKHL